MSSVETVDIVFDGYNYWRVVLKSSDNEILFTHYKLSKRSANKLAKDEAKKHCAVLVFRDKYEVVTKSVSYRYANLKLIKKLTAWI